MTFFFVGQLVRIIRSEVEPALVGVETTIIGSRPDPWQYDCWELNIPNPDCSHGWLCEKAWAEKYLQPAIPPEEAVEEEYRELAQ